MKNWAKMTSSERDWFIADQILGYDTGKLPGGDEVMWNSSGIIKPIPHYTTSMDAAWEVVEKMKSLHRLLPESATKDDLTIADKFLVHLWQLVGRRGIDALFDYTPEMICYAAWLAMTET